MSFVIAAPEALAAAASDLSGIGGAINAANAAAAGQTLGILAAGADEVSAAVAALFGAYAQQYQALSAQATNFHDQFLQALSAGGLSYVAAEAANAQQALLTVVNAPTQTLLGRPLIGDGTAGRRGSRVELAVCCGAVAVPVVRVCRARPAAGVGTRVMGQRWRWGAGGSSAAGGAGGLADGCTATAGPAASVGLALSEATVGGRCSWAMAVSVGRVGLVWRALTAASGVPAVSVATPV
ncbi:PE family protein [Mycobacterium kansasii 732]|nr:PE family protein [Mycobacterium kansasii 732]